MEKNTLLAALFAFVGLGDLAIAMFLADRIPPVGKLVLTVGGCVLLLLALLLGLGAFRIL